MSQVRILSPRPLFQALSENRESAVYRRFTERHDIPMAQQFRIATFGEPRSEWRDSREAALNDAIRLNLATWDRSKRQWFLAVPVELQVRGQKDYPEPGRQVRAAPMLPGRASSSFQLFRLIQIIVEPAGNRSATSRPDRGARGRPVPMPTSPACPSFRSRRRLSRARPDRSAPRSNRRASGG